MSEKGKNVIEMTRQMEKLFNEVAQFIKTFDKILTEYNYENIDKSSSVSNGQSTSLESSQYWLMLWMYHNYLNKNVKNEILGLNIVLDNPDQDEKMRIEEPMVAVSVIKFGSDYNDDWEPWDPYCIYFYSDPLPKEINKVYAYNDLRLDTEKMKSEREKLYDKKNILDLKFIAIPLMEFENRNDIRNKLIKILLK